MGIAVFIIWYAGCIRCKCGKFVAEYITDRGHSYNRWSRDSISRWLQTIIRLCRDGQLHQRPTSVVFRAVYYAVNPCLIHPDGRCVGQHEKRPILPNLVVLLIVKNHFLVYSNQVLSSLCEIISFSIEILFRFNPRNKFWDFM